jgi:nucleotide-binding universal stress UspA family protein
MFKCIVVGAAETEAAKLAIGDALELADTVGAELHLVLAFDPYRDKIDPETTPATHDAETFLAGIGRQATGAVHIHAVPGDPADAILGVAGKTGADLIVVGNKGMHGVGRVIGSVTNTVSHKAPCSVLIVSTT